MITVFPALRLTRCITHSFTLNITHFWPFMHGSLGCNNTGVSRCQWNRGRYKVTIWHQLHCTGCSFISPSRLMCFSNDRLMPIKWSIKINFKINHYRLHIHINSGVFSSILLCSSCHSQNVKWAALEVPELKNLCKIVRSKGPFVQVPSLFSTLLFMLLGVLLG